MNTCVPLEGRTCNPATPAQSKRSFLFLDVYWKWLKEILEEASEIHLDSHGVGKYGRVLGQLHVSNENSLTMVNVNQLLITEGHAVEYHGGKR